MQTAQLSGLGRLGELIAFHSNRLGPTRVTKGESMSEQLEALQRLVCALKDFLESGGQSEGSGNVNDPHAGMDPDELLCESVEPGGEIHNAVRAVQPFCGGNLPAPKARNPWRDLQWVCRHETDPYKRQNEAHRHAGSLQAWARGEIKKNTGGTVSETVVNSGGQVTDVDYVEKWKATFDKWWKWVRSKRLLAFLFVAVIILYFVLDVFKDWFGFVAGLLKDK